MGISPLSKFANSEVCGYIKDNAKAFNDIIAFETDIALSDEYDKAAVEEMYELTAPIAGIVEELITLLDATGGDQEQDVIDTLDNTNVVWGMVMEQLELYYSGEVEYNEKNHYELFTNIAAVAKGYRTGIVQYYRSSCNSQPVEDE